MLSEPSTGNRRTWTDDFARVSSGAGFLGLAAILVYGIQYVSYSRYYGHLGVDPKDVGLTYGTVLASSTGIVSVFVLAALAAILAYHLYIRRIFGPRARNPAFLPALVIGSGSVLFALASIALVAVADRASHDTRQGRPVLPIRNQIVGLPLLTIRADPVVVRPVGEPGKNPAVEELTRRSLLYLGSANGLAVLYDHVGETSLYVPLASVILDVRNCYIKTSPHPECQRVRGRE